MATFEFNQQLTPQSLIDIDEIGEFAIEATNDEGLFWYLIVRTSLGTTTVASCGPVVPDVPLLPSGYSSSLFRMEYKEPKIEKTITMWLNDRNKLLTSARLIDIDEAIDQFVDLRSYLHNYSEEIY